MTWSAALRLPCEPLDEPVWSAMVKDNQNTNGQGMVHGLQYRQEDQFRINLNAV